jgi:hypothetical protein
MATDNWPVSFVYISNRLVTEIVQQHEAMQSPWRASFSLNLKLAALGIRHRDLGYHNKFDLCRRATDAVRDHTGTPELPGQYVRTKLAITPGLLTVLHGWDDQSHVDIAAMFSEDQIPDVGSVLIALFGSASNYVGRRPRDDGVNEIPSDVDGLYGILDRTREQADPRIAEHFLDRDPGHTSEGRVDIALGLARDRFRGFERRRLDLLMRIFYCVDHYSAGRVHYDRVLIGAPVWAATPMPRAIDAA